MVVSENRTVRNGDIGLKLAGQSVLFGIVVAVRLGMTTNNNNNEQDNLQQIIDAAVASAAAVAVTQSYFALEHLDKAQWWLSRAEAYIVEHGDALDTLLDA